MMRQTAALQINVERGPEPLSRWLLLNSITPAVVALFSNSTSYAGKRVNHASYRAHLWRTLDDSRTGIAYDESDPVARYLNFALDAYAMRSGNRTQPYETFREWMRRPDVGLDDWYFHLTTLFPEVRPKEYFELRSADTIEAEWLPALVVFAPLWYMTAELSQRALRSSARQTTICSSWRESRALRIRPCVAWRVATSPSTAPGLLARITSSRRDVETAATFWIAGSPSSVKSQRFAL